MKVLAENLLRHEVLIFIGAFIALGTLIKILGDYDFSLDWFWFLTGLGLFIEGWIALRKQSRFDQKYKIVKRK